MDNQTDKNIAQAQVHASFQLHRQQRFWQILAPIIVGSVLALAVMAWVVLSAAGVSSGVNVSQGADTATIWILLPLMFTAVLFVIVLLGLMIGMARLLKVLPGYSRTAQFYVSHFAEQVGRAANKVTSPFITKERARAGAGAFLAALFRRSK